MELIIAAHDGDLDALRDLIAQGVDIDLEAEHMQYGGTALVWACDRGHAECARALIAAGAAVDKVDIGGRTALMWACEKGHSECVRALIDVGAAVDKVSLSGWTAPIIACREGHTACLRALIDAGAAVDTADVREAPRALLRRSFSTSTHLRRVLGALCRDDCWRSSGLVQHGHRRRH